MSTITTSEFEKVLLTIQKWIKEHDPVHSSTRELKAKIDGYIDGVLLLTEHTEGDKQ